MSLRQVAVIVLRVLLINQNMPYHHIYSTLLQLLSFPSTSFSGHFLSSHSTIHRPLHQWDAHPQAGDLQTTPIQVEL